MRILLAEDDKLLADGLCRSLRQVGYAVDHVATGTDADSARRSIRKVVQPRGPITLPVSRRPARSSWPEKPTVT